MDSEPPAPGDWLHVVLQTADALFPTGGYAHSFGLEELARVGLVREEQTFGGFLVEQLLPALEFQELPCLRFAYEAGGDVERLGGVDRRIDAWKLARETREASVQLGVRRLAVLRAILPDARLEAYWDAVHAGRARGHHLCVSALQAHVCGIPLEAALTACAYQTLSGACAAAMKLIRIGQEGVQRALSRAQTELPGCVRRSLRVAADEAGCFSPLLEIASMRHAHADERLFIS